MHANKMPTLTTAFTVRHWLMAASLPLILCGCMTGYQRHTGLFGYSDTPIRKDVYEISYAGRPSDTATQVKYFATVRAAELCMENGKPCFEILETHEDMEIVDSPVALTAITSEERDQKGKDTTTIRQQRTAVPASEHKRAILMIRLLDSSTPASLDAKAVLREANAKGVRFKDSTSRQLAPP